MDPPAASPELLAWCSAGGLRCHGVKAAFVAEGWRGVVAVQDIAAGMCVLRVPRRLLMSVESARRDPEMQAALEQADPQHLLSSEQVLAAHLLHEAAKAPASFWHPYIRSLPPSYTTAACLSEAEVAALQAPLAVVAARAAAAAAQEQHCGARALLRNLRLAPKWRSASAWRWAASTLSSRTMHMPADPAGALAPLADFHNFSPPPPPVTPTLSGLLAGASALLTERRAPTPAVPGPALAAGAPAAADKGGVSSTSSQEAEGQQAGAAGSREMDTLSGDGHLDEATNEYLIHTRTDVAAGEQVFLCYGRYTNLELLIHYGACVLRMKGQHPSKAASKAAGGLQEGFFMTAPSDYT
ncbi:Protein SET DOMAIN GROUP 40 [Chlorella vulgaris]